MTSPAIELQVQLADALVGLELRLEQLERLARTLERSADAIPLWRLSHNDQRELLELWGQFRQRLVAMECSIRRRGRAMLQNDAKTTSPE